jgi:hypothetical protein
MRLTDIGTSDALDGRVEVVECVTLHDLRADLAAHAERREAALDGDEAVRLLDRGDDLRE